MDDVHIGILEEYAGAVIEGVRAQVAQIPNVSAGKLLLNCGAHSIVGSSQFIFNRIAVIVFKLLTSEHFQLSDRGARSSNAAISRNEAKNPVALTIGHHGVVGKYFGRSIAREG